MRFAEENAGRSRQEEKSRSYKEGVKSYGPSVDHSWEPIRRSGRSFAEVLMNSKGEGNGDAPLGPPAKVVMVAEETNAFEELHGKALIGRAADLSSLTSLNLLVNRPILGGVEIQYLGGLSEGSEESSEGEGVRVGPEVVTVSPRAAHVNLLKDGNVGLPEKGRVVGLNLSRALAEIRPKVESQAHRRWALPGQRRDLYLDKFLGPIVDKPINALEVSGNNEETPVVGSKGGFDLNVRVSPDPALSDPGSFVGESAASGCVDGGLGGDPGASMDEGMEEEVGETLKIGATVGVEGKDFRDLVRSVVQEEGINMVGQ
ncbi:hypothetical protein L1987_38856 [Smallanthus sonchifolius]|uniref:Uncharacterized protein n=1 Tax=Smallanthus sonchifolius TaxID=185202 RepID=A0ACB9HL44_9ASTR|nr:hypothetical protein L1987_38856 [Smallanthus sonchifolius]